MKYPLRKLILTPQLLSELLMFANQFAPRPVQQNSTLCQIKCIDTSVLTKVEVLIESCMHASTAWVYVCVAGWTCTVQRRVFSDAALLCAHMV